MSEIVWISHRGACGPGTENTAQALQGARDKGFTYLETDLRSTADGELVLAHDLTMERIGGSNLNVCETARQYLKRIPLGNGQRLLFFDEFLPEFSDSHWILDIKPEYGERTIDLLLEWWAKPEYSAFFEQRARFLFWNKSQQAYFLKHKPEAVCMAQIRACRRAGVATWLGAPGLGNIRSGVTYALPPRLWGRDVLRPDVVAQYHQRGARVLAFLPRNEKETRHAMAVGVDEILTDGEILRD